MLRTLKKKWGSEITGCLKFELIILFSTVFWSNFMVSQATWSVKIAKYSSNFWGWGLTKVACKKVYCNLTWKVFKIVGRRFMMSNYRLKIGWSVFNWNQIWSNLRQVKLVLGSKTWWEENVLKIVSIHVFLHKETGW